MTRRRLVGQFGKAIEAAFTPYNLVPGPDDPPVLKVMSFEEFSRLQTEEIIRIGSKIVGRIEQLFRLYCVTRTGDDFCDFKSLALEMAIELFPISLNCFFLCTACSQTALAILTISFW